MRRVAPQEALGAFSVLHGHVPIGGPQRLHEPFEEYAAWLRDRHLIHSPDQLRSWVEREYRADDTAAVVPPIEPGPRLGLSPRVPAAKRD